MWQAQSDSGYKKSRREIGQDWRRTGEPHTNDENGGEGKSWHQNIAETPHIPTVGVGVKKSLILVI